MNDGTQDRRRHRRQRRHRQGHLPRPARAGLRGRLAGAPQGRDRPSEAAQRARSTCSTAKATAEAAKEAGVALRGHHRGAQRRRDLAALLPEVQLSDLDALVDLHLGCGHQLGAGRAARDARALRPRRCCCRRARALGLATRTSYSATKAGMLGMARTWALELAPEGITVNVVAPGPIRTDMFYDVVEAGSEKERALAASVPVRRLGESADVARAVRFFADPANSFVTGRCSTSAAAPASAAGAQNPHPPSSRHPLTPGEEA